MRVDPVYGEYMFVAQCHQSELIKAEIAIQNEDGTGELEVVEAANPTQTPPAKKPSGALSNPDPNIPDITMEEYQASLKSDFGRSAASPPPLVDGAFQCSANAAGELYQNHPQGLGSKSYPMLPVHCCMLIC